MPSKLAINLAYGTLWIRSKNFRAMRMMTLRKLATVAVVDNVKTHPNADSLDLLTIRGWQVVAKRDEFKAGDPCVYIEIDSILPEREEFEFLRKSKFRIKTIRLRGELSQGIVFPLSIVPEIRSNEALLNGDDLTDALGVTLYSPPVPAFLSGDAKGVFPSFIPKTDAERIQNNKWLLDPASVTVDDAPYWVATEKLDGSSVSYFLKDGVFGVCSRNLELKDTENNAYWIAARKYDLEEKLRTVGRNIALQGELIGPKIQGNPYKRMDLEVYFFDVYDIDKGCYFDYPDQYQTILSLKLNNVPIVRVIPSEDLRCLSVDKLLIIAEGISELWRCEREGLVWKPAREMTNPRIGRVMFKAISNRFLLGE